MSPGGAGSKSHNSKSSLLLSFKKEESSFLKERIKRLLFSRADVIVRFRSEACFLDGQLIYLPHIKRAQSLMSDHRAYRR